MLIGIDFDNTIAEYDALFSALAQEAGLGPPAGVPSDGGPPESRPSGGAPPESRMALRRRLRGAGPAGETAWRDLQALAYGPRMGGARLFDGVLDFLRAAHEQGAVCAVISHKTRYALQDAERRHDLREAALAWMAAQGLFAAGLLSPDRVFFHEEQAEKIARIGALGCGHFIDDLEEVFNRPDFPPGVTRHLLAADGRTPHLDAAAGPVLTHPSWRSIRRAIFP